MLLSTKILLTLLPLVLQSTAQSTGKTTRYWDCCKPSCSWTKKISLAVGSNPVSSCDINDRPLVDFDAKSGCNGGGPAYMCTNQMPWAVSDNLAYGYAAVSISGGTEASWCCACYELTFTTGPVAGKKMIVQATNTGGDLGSNHFDIAMPGGGFGIFNGCSAQWGTPSTGWGQQYGGISSRSQCDNFAPKLKAGCQWRFDWFQNADNPGVSFKQVTCPAALTSKTGCVRAGEVPSNDPVTVVTTKAQTTTTKAQTTTPAGPTSKLTTTTTTTAPVNSGPGVTRFSQCGGIGWLGGTVCAAGLKCNVVNPWYWQCV